uniref:Uncharacterized protein n=1 Tax=Anguilla anguilla TaxID=7936 RepID=A0A0E9QBT8_ANGAN
MSNTRTVFGINFQINFSCN